MPAPPTPENEAQIGLTSLALLARAGFYDPRVLEEIATLFSRILAGEYDLNEQTGILDGCFAYQQQVATLYGLPPPGNTFADVSQMDSGLFVDAPAASPGTPAPAPLAIELGIFALVLLARASFYDPAALEFWAQQLGQMLGGSIALVDAPDALSALDDLMVSQGELFGLPMPQVNPDTLTDLGSGLFPAYQATVATSGWGNPYGARAAPRRRARTGICVRCGADAPPGNACCASCAGGGPCESESDADSDAAHLCSPEHMWAFYRPPCRPAYFSQMFGPQGDAHLASHRV